MFAFRKARRPQTLPAEAPAALIDVRDLIARYSNAEHVARANAYFATMPSDAKLMRKPFFGIGDTQSNMHGVAEVLQRLALFPGACVLDFGAGTGWFSRMLAFLDCEPIAVDVSAAALALGEQAFARDPIAAGLSVAWRPFDGVTLPAADGSVDRIVCYDSFHHVADQAGMLREFYRVLTEGGLAVFHEPGPNHSKAPISQYEMRHFDVIENDIVIEEIWALASQVGFSKLELALSTPHTLSVPLDQYSRIIAGRAKPADTSAVLERISTGAQNLRIFTLSKGEAMIDSRQTAGLAGTFAVTLTETAGAVLRGHARVTNTGSTLWRPSDGSTGSVWLGVQRASMTADRDFGRIKLSDLPVQPGETIEVDFAVTTPAERPLLIAFDLVAER